MSVQVEKLEKNMAKLTIEVAEDKFAEALKTSYEKQKNKISVPGFRKGKVPMAMIEKMYGPEIFYEEAANELIPDAYASAVEESGLDIVSQPTIDVVQIEKGKTFIFTAEVAVKPEVTLGTYKGVEVAKVDTTVTDEEVTEAVERERNNNARTINVEDRAIVDGDTAIIDFDGSVDGVPFEGGKAENYSLTIGSHSFIDTFEEQLIGKNIGDDVDVNVTFPEDYHATELAGKPALFKVKIHEIKAKELPELNDEFAQDVSEFDTLDEYKADVKKNLEKTKADNAKRAQEDEAIGKIIEGATMEIPDAMIDTQVNNMLNEFAQRMSMQGLSMEQYMQYTGMTVDKLREQIRPDALTRIQSRLVLEQIVADEKIEISEAEVDEELKKMSEMYQMEVDKLKEMIGESELTAIKMDLAVSKAIEVIMDNVKESK